MPGVNERFDSVDRRLESVEASVGGLRDEVGGLRDEVGGLRDEVGGLRGEVGGLRDEVGGLRGEVGGLRGEVNNLRVLFEAHDDQIRHIADVQTHHGKKLDQLSKDLEPLREIRDFIRLVAHDHERRITALEQRTDAGE